MFELIILLIILIAGVSGYLAYKKVSSLKRDYIPEDLIILHVRVPKEIERDEVKTAPVAAERMFSSLHGLLNTTGGDNQEVINFEINSSRRGTNFYVTIPSELQSFVESQIYANYSGAQIEKVEDYINSENYKDKQIVLSNLVLSKKSFFPLKTFKEFEVDPLNAITETLSSLKENHEVSIQYSIMPAEDTWQEEGHKYASTIRSGGIIGDSILSLLVKAVGKGFSNLIFGYKEEDGVEQSSPKLTPIDELHLSSIEDKLTKMGYIVNIKILSAADSITTARDYIRTVRGSFKQYNATGLNSFETGSKELEGEEALSLYKERRISSESSYILNTDELASVFHFPSLVSTPNISFTQSKKGEPPLNLPIEGDITYFGTTSFRNKKVKFGIKNTDDRLRHMYFVGKTGAGKSTLFENMIIQDIRDGRGCGYIDPHGETIEKILSRIPKDRVDDVVLIDPSDQDNPVGINVMECPDPRQKNLLASSVLSAFALQFGYSWGPRLEYLLNYAILTLMEIEGTSLLGITRLFQDKNYLKYILEKVEDPMVKRFWNEEFEGMKGSSSLAAEAVSPIQNKVNRLLSSSTIRNILGQRNSTVRFNEVMDNKKILLVNLSKGKIGEDNANLLGSLFVNRLMFYAMQRASIPESERIPFYLYVDEFQNFATESFATILSEARKYGLSLNLTNQYTAQLPETIKDAILGNVGSLIALTLGAQDAEIFAPEFEPTFEENDLITQEKFHFYCKLYIDGSTSKPFSGVGLPPVYSEENYSDIIKEESAKKYGRSKEYVEEKIRRWIERPFDAGMAIAERYRALEDAKSKSR